MLNIQAIYPECCFSLEIWNVWKSEVLQIRTECILKRQNPLSEVP